MVHNKSLHFVKKVVDDNFFFRRMMLAVVAGWLDFSEYQSFSNIISSKFCSPSRLHSMLVGQRVHSKEIHSKEREGESMSLAR